MATYTKRASASAGYTHGQPAAVQSPVSGGGSGKRRTWWWQAGLLDSCCCCFSLRAGVALLAASDLLVGTGAILYVHTFYVSILQGLLATLQSKYFDLCYWAEASTLDCEELSDHMQLVKGQVGVYLRLPKSVYALGFICIVSGFVGLSAVFLRGRRAVKVYMLSWPVKFWLGMWVALCMRKLQVQYEVGQGSTTAILWLLHAICLLYGFKVSWSYYKKRLGHEEGANTRASSGYAACDEEAVIEGKSAAYQCNVEMRRQPAIYRSPPL